VYGLTGDGITMEGSKNLFADFPQKKFELHTLWTGAGWYFLIFVVFSYSLSIIRKNFYEKY